jgi:2-phosphosulfolactate phosphatase
MFENQRSMPLFRRANLETCGSAGGLVVVIDVLRAFSTAAYAFAAGAKEILLAGTVEEALELGRQFPDAMLMGEVGGLPIKAFDFSNSPASLTAADLSDRRLIQRTSAGTQGMVRSTQAGILLAGSFVIASATARMIEQAHPESVTFVITGANAAGWGEDIATQDDLWGDEDAACADYLEELLKGRRPDPEPYLVRVKESLAGQIFSDPEKPGFPVQDVDLCTRIDRFNFSLAVHREDGLLKMRPVFSH